MTSRRANYFLKKGGEIDGWRLSEIFGFQSFGFQNRRENKVDYRKKNIDETFFKKCQLHVESH
jgi:hypothetical protein